MNNEIGRIAGILWEYLNKNGEASPSSMARETKLSANQVQRAIGWLGREDKIHIEKDGRSERISLNILEETDFPGEESNRAE